MERVLPVADWVNSDPGFRKLNPGYVLTVIRAGTL